LNYQNKNAQFARIPKVFAALLITSNKIILMIQQNYFQICIQQNFRSLSKIILSVQVRKASPQGVDGTQSMK